MVHQVLICITLMIVPMSGFSNTWLRWSTMEVLGLQHVVWPMVGQLLLYPFLGSKFTAKSLLFPSALTSRSQPFWGQMVARAGAGPKPIPYASLDARVLADAIAFCFTPAVASSARNIALKMQHESGVTAAVQSFHRHLPLNKMRCSLIPSQPAIWSYTRSKGNINLSKTAVQILINNCKIDVKHLRWCVSLPIYFA